MIIHNVKSSVRGFLRNKFFTSINILGLSISMGACLAIFQYIHFELSYDKFHTNTQNTYRLLLTMAKNGEESSQPKTSYAVGPGGKEEIPEIKQFVRVHPQYFGALVTNPDQNKVFNEEEESMLFVDSTFLAVFNFSLKQGNPKRVLSDKNNIVITETMAEKYFGPGVNPIGRILKVDGWVTENYIVSGVLDNLVSNSHLKFNFLIPMQSLLESEEYNNGKGEWGRTNFFTYVIVDENTSIETIETKFDQLIDRHFGKTLTHYNETWNINLQPVADIHLKSSMLQHDLLSIDGSVEAIKIFAIIGVFIMIIGWINFVNLSTARAVERAKGIGIRKIMGAFRSQLMSQFMVESILINLVSSAFSIIIGITLLTTLSDVIGERLNFNFNYPEFWIGFVALVVVGSLVSGLYPAFILSSFKSVGTQRINNKGGNSGGISLRRGLVVFQFLTSVLLISGTFLVYKQVNFMKNQELGVDMEQILVVRGPSVISDLQNLPLTLSSFKAECLDFSSVLTGSVSGTVPGKGSNSLTPIRKLGDLIKDSQHVGLNYVDFDFFETYSFQFLSGRPFDQHFVTDRNAVIINEEVINVLGIDSPEEALQKQLIIGMDTVTVIGVLKNYHWNSLKDAYSPSVFIPAERARRFFSFKINLSNIPQSLNHLRSTYTSFFDGNPFDYFFLEDEFNSQYNTDLKLGKLIGTFSLLAIFIAGLGLFALVSFSTSMRTKEIGVRKVLGATVQSLLMLLSREYLLLLFIASVLAIPIILFGASQWLSNYAFRFKLGPDLFLVPLFVLLLISAFTVGYRVFIAARTNPVDSLKT